MNTVTRKDRRGGTLLLILLGILMIVAWVGVDHTGRLLNLIFRQRETLQRLHATDVPTRSIMKPACEVRHSDSLPAEQDR